MIFKLYYSLSQFLIKVKIFTTTTYSQKNVHVDNKNTLYCDRMDVSKGISINKTSATNECGICYY